MPSERSRASQSFMANSLGSGVLGIGFRDPEPQKLLRPRIWDQDFGVWDEGFRL